MSQLPQEEAATVNRGALAASAWSPLREPLFRVLWVAGVVSNVGSWMQNVGGAWFMTSLSASPIMVALMQTATTLPIMLFGLPAGALADIVDRRRLLLASQLWMFVAATALALLTFTGMITAWWLLGLTFVLGVGGAVAVPVWQAITPEIVSRERLAEAVGLASVSVNIARAVGPAVGGVIVAAAGPGWVFLLNALSFLGVIVAVYRWRRAADEVTLPPERIPEAVWTGWQYVRFSEPLRAVMVRAAVFITGAAALWALLPVVARERLGVGSIGYGVLYGSIGLGALLGAVVLPRLRRRYPVNALATGGAATFAATTAAFSFFTSFPLLCAMMVIGGIAWISIMVSLNVAVLVSSPRWVQARSAGLYMMVFQGGIAVASVFWGAVAERLGSGPALIIAAIVLLAGLPAALRWPIVSDQEIDLRPSLHWAEPVVVEPPAPDDGPVLVIVEYRIDPARSADFARAMADVRRLRLRDGAIRTNLFRDSSDPGRYLETFLVDSWLEHMRQHQRVTFADREIESRARAFHVGAKPPVVEHFIAEPRAR